MESMTGFANRSVEKKHLSISVNLKSINSRYLDVKLNIPLELYSLEEEFRRKVKKSITRGTVEISVSFLKVEMNEALEGMDKWIRNYRSLVKKYDLKDDLTLTKVLKQAQSSGGEMLTDKEKKSIMLLFDKTLKVLLQKRKAEGAELKKVLEDEVSQIKKTIISLKSFIKTNEATLKEEWEKRLKKVSEDVPPEKLAGEVAALLEKSDITEEVKRLEIHVKEFLSLVRSREVVLGKKLDFFCQELYREANTVASKSKKVELTRLSVNLKSSIEKLRQQVQNIQ